MCIARSRFASSMNGLFSDSVKSFHSAPNRLLISELCILGFSWAIFRRCARDHTMNAFIGRLTWSMGLDIKVSVRFTCSGKNPRTELALRQRFGWFKSTRCKSLGACFKLTASFRRGTKQTIPGVILLKLSRKQCSQMHRHYILRNSRWSWRDKQEAVFLLSSARFLFSSPPW